MTHARLLLILALAGCAPKAPPRAPGAHPLLGRIWSSARGRFVSERALVEELLGEEVDFVLLGEDHDNPEHHRLQARLISAIEPLAVGFEMLDEGDPLNAPDPAGLARAVGWEDSGWPAFSLYWDVFEAAFETGARIVAAHPTRERVEQVMSDGFEALPPEATSGLALDRPLPEPERLELEAELAAAHPGEAGRELVERMVRAQILKDLWMARALMMSSRPAVLIAGGGHTRTDRGVPLYLQGGARVVRFVEVEEGEEDPGGYDEAADWLWFTAP